MKEMKIIKRGFKPSPLGLIPNDWEVKELKKLVQKIGSGITPKGGERVYKIKGKPFLRSQNVGWGTLLLNDIAFIDEDTHGLFKSTEIKEEDVFLNITGASIGRSAIADKRVVGGNVNQHVCIIRTNKKELYPHYLNSFLLSQKGQNLIDSYQAGGNRQGLNFEQIKSFKVPVPPLKEQTAIANLLSTWDKAIQTTTQFIAQKELRKQALMQQLLTGKKRLKGFNGKWKETKLKFLGEFSKGSGILKTELIEHGLPAIRYGEIYTTHHLRIKNFRSFISKETAKSSKPILAGDILFAGSGETSEEIGKCVVYLDSLKAYAGGDIIIFRPCDGDSLFLSYLLNSETIIKQKSSMGKGHSVVHIYPKDLAEIILRIPKQTEQTAIASVLQTADSEIEILKQKLDKMKEQKKGLMQILLTGKKRLKIK